MRKKIVLIVGASILLAACSNGEQEAGSSPSSDTASASASPSPTVAPTWSLTGMPADKVRNLDPVVLVKIENDPVVRPQTGLDAADMVVEELVEGGMTRFAAIYQSQLPEVVGPVRSVRHVDAAIAAPIADAFVFSGGAKRTMNFLYRKIPATTTIVTEGGIGMYRDSNHAAPHNVFLKLNELVSSLAPTQTPTNGLFEQRTEVSFAAPAPLPSSSAGTTDALTITEPTAISVAKLKFSTNSAPQWTWDSATSAWLRSERTTPSVTPTGAQLKATNVVVLFVETMDAGYTDPAGNYVPRSVLTSGGAGYVLNSGVAMPITWTKEKVASPITLFDGSGAVLELPNGNSWIELLPRNEGEISFS